MKTWAELYPPAARVNGLPVLLVLADGRLRELTRAVEEAAEVRPLTAADPAGMDTYARSVHFLLLRAAQDVLPDGQLTLHFSHGNGYYYTVGRGEGGAVPASEHMGMDAAPQPCGRDGAAKKAVTAGAVSLGEAAAQLLARMRELVAADLPITKRLVASGAARALFREAGQSDKAHLFRYRRVSAVNLYTLDGYTDYFYGYMVPSTGYLPYFGVEAYEGGLVLVLPDRKQPTKVLPFGPYPGLFAVQNTAEQWGARLGIETVADLNDEITEGKIEHDLLVAEALQERRIAEIAADIRDRGAVRFVMVAGPSSSGKTTFARRLSIQLSAHGLVPHPISLDNFYLDRRFCPRDEEGNYDFECLESLDLPLIRQTLADLEAGREVALPRFNFITGQREDSGQRLRLSKGDILVIEGIHGLNDALSAHLPKESVFRVYISALTQLNLDGHNHISTTAERLLRRIVRDYRTRGTNAEETIAMWPSVRRGEQAYIFPHQERADVMFNSALVYELAVLKVYAEPLLFQVPEDSPAYLEANRLLKFLDYFLPMPADHVPMHSILREFIGGSCFSV